MRKRDLGMRLMAMHLDSGRTSSLLRMITQVLLQFCGYFSRLRG